MEGIDENGLAGFIVEDGCKVETVVGKLTGEIAVVEVVVLVTLGWRLGSVSIFGNYD
jgi:hypothetical protein